MNIEGTNAHRFGVVPNRIMSRIVPAAYSVAPSNSTGRNPMRLASRPACPAVKVAEEHEVDDRFTVTPAALDERRDEAQGEREYGNRSDRTPAQRSP